MNVCSLMPSVVPLNFKVDFFVVDDDDDVDLFFFLALFQRGFFLVYPSLPSSVAVLVTVCVLASVLSFSPVIVDKESNRVLANYIVFFV